MSIQTNNTSAENDAATSRPTGPFDKINNNDWGNNARLALDLLSSEQREKLSSRKQTESVESPPGFDNNRAHFDCPHELLKELHRLTKQENTNLSAQLDLLVRFDEIEGWRESGAKNCVAWITAHLHLDRRTAWERLRVGRELRKLPLISRLFQIGRLSWSKVRVLTRIANAENEQLLAHASTDATVSDVQRICDEYRWAAEDSDLSDAFKARMHWENRALKWQTLSDGSVLIKLVLPPDRAQNYLHAINHCENILYHERAEEELLNSANSNLQNNDVKEASVEQPVTPSQRKADAAVLLAERSLAFDGDQLLSADRFQVVLNIDHDSLVSAQSLKESDHQSGETPPRKPMIEGIGAVPVATARQIACDCHITQIISKDGEPLSIGRKQRMWPPSMRRAILNRDRHCQFPGCTSHQHLQIHHIVHWADGGETSTDNGVCLCQFHHQLVHSEGYIIERATINTKGFETTGLYSASKKKLLPTRCRFIFTRNATESEKEFSDFETDNLSPRGHCSDSSRIKPENHSVSESPAWYGTTRDRLGDSQRSPVTCS